MRASVSGSLLFLVPLEGLTSVPQRWCSLQRKDNANTMMLALLGPTGMPVNTICDFVRKTAVITGKRIEITKLSPKQPSAHKDYWQSSSSGQLSLYLIEQDRHNGR